MGEHIHIFLCKKCKALHIFQYANDAEGLNNYEQLLKTPIGYIVARCDKCNEGIAPLIADTSVVITHK